MIKADLRLGVAFAALAAMWLCEGPALAQSANQGAGAGEIDDIVVTARRRQENSQSTPLAVTALSGNSLQNAGADSTPEVFALVPNASFGGGIGGDLQGLVSIRGISSLVRIIGVESGLGFYVDGVFMGRPENFNQDLIDIERVEVLRGPQGALYGRNTIAGAVNIITTTPGDAAQANGEVQLGNYDLRRVRGLVSGPLIADRAFGKLAFGHVSRGGFVRHASGGQDLDTLDLTTLRGQLRLTPSPGVELLIAADALIDRGEPAFFETADVAMVDDPTEATPFTTNQDQPNHLDRDIYGASVTANIGGFTSITSYRSSSFDAALDDDKTPFRFLVDFFADDVSLFTQELRYARQIGDHLNLMGGLYYLRQEADSFRPFAVGDFLTGMPGFEPPITQTSSVDTESYAAFFSGDWSINDRLTASIGGRYTHEEKEARYIQEDTFGLLFPNIDFSGSTSDDDFSPTLSLSYRFPERTYFYLRYARGFKSAGFNTDFAASAENLTVTPETAVTYEAGVRMDLFSHRLRLNATMFQTDYRDLQVSQISGAGVVLRNAAHATISGAEFEAAAILGEHLRMDASIGFLDAHYDDFPGCPAPSAAPPAEIRENCRGNRTVFAPEWTGALGMEWTTPAPAFGGDWVVRGDWRYQSEVFFEPQNTRRLSGDARNVVNLRAGVRTGAWDFSIWAENAGDETYVTFADDRSAIAVPLTRAYGAPRTYGATLRLRH